MISYVNDLVLVSNLKYSGHFKGHWAVGIKSHLVSNRTLSTPTVADKRKIPKNDSKFLILVGDFNKKG